MLHPTHSRRNLPASSETHHVRGVVLLLRSLEARKAVSEDPVQRRARDGVVAVQRRVGDVLALADGDLRELLRTLHGGVAEEVVGERGLPCKVDVEREQALGAAGRVGGG